MNNHSKSQFLSKELVRTSLWLITFCFVLIFSSSVQALDPSLHCRYQDYTQYDKWVFASYENETYLNYNLLEIKDITKDVNPPSFKVYNNYNSPINVTITYVLGYIYSVYSIIPAKDYITITSTPVDPPISTIDESKINLYIKTPGLTIRREMLQTVIWWMGYCR